MQNKFLATSLALGLIQLFSASSFADPSAPAKPATPAPASAPAAPACKVARGQVDYPAQLLYPSMPSGIQAWVTRVEPSADCKTLRMWFYTPGPQGQVIRPTNKQCAQLGGDYSPIPGLGPCNDMTIYPDEASAVGKPRPLAYMKDGALILKEANFMGPAQSEVLMPSGPDRLLGMRQADDSFMTVTAVQPPVAASNLPANPRPAAPVRSVATQGAHAAAAGGALDDSNLPACSPDHHYAVCRF